MVAKPVGLYRTEPATMRRWLPHLAILLVAGSVHLSGGFSVVERPLTDLKFRLFTGEASKSLIVVEIDPASVRQIGVWPWPRRYHAAAIDNLIAAGATRVGVMLDLSSPSNEQDDALLEQVLEAAEGRVVLPAFAQRNRTENAEERFSIRRPLSRFRDHVAMASVNVFPDRDGLVRSIEASAKWPVNALPTMPRLLASHSTWTTGPVRIDFGIDPESIPRLSIVDVIEGRFDPDLISGRQVLIGASAVELGDWLAVPLYRALPGVVVTALAYETAVQGRNIRFVSNWIIFLAGAVLAFGAGPALAGMPWRSGLMSLVGGSACIVALSLATHAIAAIAVDVVPLVSIVVVCFAYGLVRQTDLQAMRAFATGMAASHERLMFRNVAQNTTDGILVVQNDGAIEFGNPAAENLLGSQAGALVGRKVETILPDAGFRYDRDGVLRLDLPENSTLPAHESAALTVNGARVSVEFVAVNVEIAPEPTRFERRRFSRRKLVVNLRDITTRKAHQKELNDARLAAEAASHAKSFFLANMSHELRTPLNAVIGFSEAMIAQIYGPLGHPRYLEYAQDIRNSGQFLLSFVGDLLDVAKAEAGELELHEETIDLSELVETSKKTLRAAYPAGTVRLESGVPDDLPRLHGDPRRVRQIITNLVSNSIAHATAEVDVRVQVRQEDEGGISIAIADNGPGIPRDKIPEIMKPFVSLRSNVAHSGGGSGLGLALVDTLAKQHGGQVVIDSEVGVGTTVTVQFPPDRTVLCDG